MPQLIGPGDLIIASWQNFRRNIRMYAEFLVWFTMLAVIQWVIWAATRALIPEAVMRSMVLAILTLPTALVVMGLTAALIDATAKGVQKKAVDVRAALSAGVHKLFPFVWISILVSLITIFGFTLLIVPGVIFLVWYRFSQNFAVVDGIGGVAALGASKRLVAGRFWAVFVRIVLPGLFFFVTASFTKAVAYLLIGSAMGDPGLFFGQASNVDELSNTHTMITSVVPQIVNGMALPLFLGADILLWLDLKKTLGSPS
jgi:hypothetical protein